MPENGKVGNRVPKWRFRLGEYSGRVYLEYDGGYLLVPFEIIAVSDAIGVTKTWTLLLLPCIGRIATLRQCRWYWSKLTRKKGGECFLRCAPYYF